MRRLGWAVVALLVSGFGAREAAAFDSGSTGALGALTPGSNVQIPLPPDGVLHYTEVLIPAGVTVSFVANDRNTPVYLLASGNVTINGVIDVSGKQGTTVNKKHITYLGGAAGPGGSPGGSSREGVGVNAWQDGLGPGAGRGTNGDRDIQGSGGASHIQAGAKTAAASAPAGGAAHANNTVWALHGGSGGGVGYGTLGNPNDYWATPSGSPKTSGGGGGGALTIAANGTITVSGSILANGGPRWGAAGGGGGGSVRLVASNLTGNGIVSARGDINCGGQYFLGACGANGFLLFEAYDMGGAFITLANPAPFFGQPRPALPFVQGAEPSLEIVSVGGQAAPVPAAGAHPLANPTLTLQQGSSVEVLLQARNVPVGTVVKVGVNRLGASRVIVDAPPLAGSVALSTTAVSVSIPAGTRAGAVEAWIPSFTSP